MGLESIAPRTAGGRLVLNVLTSVGQWEREATGERTREVLQHLRRQGVRLGGAAIGWTRTTDIDEDGRQIVTVVDAEVQTVERMYRLAVARPDGEAIRSSGMRA